MRFVYVEISEQEAREMIDQGKTVFVHPFKPSPMNRFIPGSVPVQVQMSESGARLQPEMYMKLIEVSERPAPAPKNTEGLSHHELYPTLYPKGEK